MAPIERRTSESNPGNQADLSVALALLGVIHGDVLPAEHLLPSADPESTQEQPDWRAADFLPRHPQL
jgi:hypothetical protein